MPSFSLSYSNGLNLMTLIKNVALKDITLAVIETVIEIQGVYAASVSFNKTLIKYKQILAVVRYPTC